MALALDGSLRIGARSQAPLQQVARRHQCGLRVRALFPLVPAKLFGSGGLVGWNRCRPRHLICEGAPCVMELSLHANATTTPKVRAYIQRSRKPVADLAAELGVSEPTVRRWRGRTAVADRSRVAK